MSNLRVGLVLGSGGARAAYQVGVIEALAKLPVDVAAVSGVGVGAINAAILAGSGDLPAAAATLRQMWTEAAEASGASVVVGPFPVLSLGLYSDLVFSSGVTPSLNETAQTAWRAGKLTRGTKMRLPDFGIPGAEYVGVALDALAEMVDVRSDEELERFMSQGIGEALTNLKMPCFVAVQELRGGVLEQLRLGLQGASLLSPSPPRYLDLASEQDMERRLGLLLGSAALPFWGKAQTVGGKGYADASFGGASTAPGAVPITPLRRQAKALGLDAIIVVHSASGVAWSSSSSDDVSIIELRASGIEDYTGFWTTGEAGLQRAFKLGADDAERRLREVLEGISAWDGYKAAQDDLAGLRRLLDD